MQTIVKSATKRLWEAVEAQGEDLGGMSKPGMIMPSSFLKGLRGALVAGLTCEELVSLMLIITGIREMEHDYDRDELVMRTTNIVNVMRGDIDYMSRQQELEKRRIKIRNAGKKSKKKRSN